MKYWIKYNKASGRIETESTEGHKPVGVGWQPLNLDECCFPNTGVGDITTETLEGFLDNVSGPCTFTVNVDYNGQNVITLVYSSTTAEAIIEDLNTSYSTTLRLTFSSEDESLIMTTDVNGEWVLTGGLICE